MIIVLMGYMGSGKSFVGKQLAHKLKYRFVDLDEYIETEENAKITSLFKDKGAIYFRKKESEYLERITNDSDNMVLSLGGGTPCYGNNLELINQNPKVISIYLKASVSYLSGLLFEEKEKRPLIANIDSVEAMQEFIGKHIFERAPIYEQAKHSIINENKSVKNVMEEIIALLF